MAPAKIAVDDRALQAAGTGKEAATKEKTVKQWTAAANQAVEDRAQEAAGTGNAAAAKRTD